MPGELSFSDNSDQVARRISNMADRVERELDTFLVEAGYVFAEEAAKEAPVASGDLQESIELQPDVQVDDDGTRYVSVTSDSRYAGIQESGARHYITGDLIGRKGFFKHAGNETEEYIRDHLEDRIQRALDDG